MLSFLALLRRLADQRLTFQLGRYIYVGLLASSHFCYERSLHTDLLLRLENTSTTTVANQSTASQAFQAKLYWVSTTKVDRRDIGASIQQPDGMTVSTQGGDYDSHVTLTGIPPIRYTTDSISKEKGYTDHGKWNMKWYSIKGEYAWNQDNYFIFITSRGHPFKKAEPHEYYSGDQETLHNCFFYKYDADGLRLYYIWDDTAEDKESVGLLKSACRYKTELVNDATAQICINQRSQALCLTHMDFKVAGLRDFYNLLKEVQPYEPNCWFRFFDIYGKWGDFHVKPSDEGDDIILSNKN